MPKPKFELLAGDLCLDFANTLDKRFSSHPEDNLNGYEALVAFGEQTGVFSHAEAEKLLEDGRKNRGEATKVFRQAVELRETIFRILWAVAECGEASEADAHALNAALQRVRDRSLVAPVRAQTAWQWIEKGSGAERLLARIVRSAVEVLTSDDIERVKRCASEKCCWLFLDRSRSGNRRWCEMRTCGSQHKAKAYYQRKTAGNRAKR